MAKKSARVEAFSDGVLAIVITLLVLEIHVPELHDALSRHEAWAGLRALAPKFGSFVLSFAYVAVFWVNHHHFFDLIEDVTPALVWLNNLLLLFLCLIPFPTAFIGEYPGNPVALGSFAAVVMGAGMVFTLMWWYAYRRGLVHRSVTPAIARDSVLRGLSGPPLYVVAGAAAFATPWVTWTLFGAVPVFFLLHSMKRPWHKPG